MGSNFISAREVLREIISRFGLRGVHNLPVYDMLVWMGHALKHIGGYQSLETTTKTVQIVNYTGEWPLDMHAIIRVHGYPKFKNMRTGFQVDLQEGEVTIEYDRFPLDEDGYPLFKNDPSTIDAIVWFVGWYLAIQGILPNSRISPQYCESKWQWYCGQARAEGYVPSMDQWERMVNTFYRLVPLDNEYNNEFYGQSSREFLERDAINGPSLFN